MMEEVRVVLPDHYDLVVGDTFQLFYRGIVEAPNPYVYDIFVLCEKGRAFPRYFEYTPSEEGEYMLTVSVYSNKKELLGRGRTTLKVKYPKESEKPINILCMGASNTLSGDWPYEAYRRLAKTDGFPVGHGFSNYNFVGTKKRDEIGYEGYGGWAWQSYTSRSCSGVWFFCEHNKDKADQHSLWQDEDGRVWKLETILPDRIKFIRINHTSEDLPSLNSVVKPIDTIKHSEPITIKRIYNEISSPFYNVEEGRFDFESYCKRCGIDKIDVVYTFLGVNGLSADKINYESIDSIRDFTLGVVEKAKVLVKEFRKAFPDIKFRIMGTMIPSINGGIGTNYGAKLPYGDRYGFTRYIFELNKAYENWCREDEYSSFMEFVNISGQFDSENCYPAEDKPVNVRSAKKERIEINGVHPTLEGYMMIADAVYRNLVHFE